MVLFVFKTQRVLLTKDVGLWWYLESFLQQEI